MRFSNLLAHFTPVKWFREKKYISIFCSFLGGFLYKTLTLWHNWDVVKKRVKEVKVYDGFLYGSGPRGKRPFLEQLDLENTPLEVRLRFEIQSYLKTKNLLRGSYRIDDTKL